MMTGLLFTQQQQQKQQVLEENMSNLTSASGEASVSSSGNRTEVGTNYPQQYFTTPPPQAQPVKKKRNLPGNPDPDAEVIALTPKTLMEKNRFVCDICNKGFQRDQNLQLHRRGHNLPWKLKKRTSKEVRKKVYVCPESSCVHHDPSRALGDLTGIKKHFSRKHGEKKWKCERCSKKYAVQSDWKTHSKTCGTREYRCDCGTIFSRRDSFITHRAFCDVLAEESARAIPGAQSLVNLQFNPQDMRPFSLKKEQQSFTSLRPEIPPWLVNQPSMGPPPQNIDLSSSSSSIFSQNLDHRHHQNFTQQAYYQDLALLGNHNPNPSVGLGPSTVSMYHQTTVPPPHMSATALLQKAAQMGSTRSSSAAPSSTSTTTVMIPHIQTHVSVDSAGCNTGFGLSYKSVNMSRAETSAPLMTSGQAAAGPGDHHHHHHLSFLEAGFNPTSFDDIGFSGILNAEDDGGGSFNDQSFTKTTTKSPRNDRETTVSQGEGMTRDFLGLRAFSHSDILNMAGLNNCMNTTSHDQQQRNQSQKPW